MAYVAAASLTASPKMPAGVDEKRKLHAGASATPPDIGPTATGGLGAWLSRKGCERVAHATAGGGACARADGAASAVEGMAAKRP